MTAPDAMKEELKRQFYDLLNSQPEKLEELKEIEKYRTSKAEYLVHFFNYTPMHILNFFVCTNAAAAVNCYINLAKLNHLQMAIYRNKFVISYHPKSSKVILRP